MLWQNKQPMVPHNLLHHDKKTNPMDAKEIQKIL